jgi:hypothetical protein
MILNFNEKSLWFYLHICHMEEHLVYSLGTQLVKVKPIDKNLYRVTVDNRPIGNIRKKDGGWMMEEYAKEELTAETVQLIGDKIDRLPWQFKQ